MKQSAPLTVLALNESRNLNYSADAMSLSYS